MSWRWHAAELPGKKLGSLLINPGGPGGSGVDLLGNSADMFSPEVFSGFDVVGFDPGEFLARILWNALQMPKRMNL